MNAGGLLASAVASEWGEWQTLECGFQHFATFY
jgi:hypothetical protein